MTDRQWFSDGVQINESTRKEYFADGIQISANKGFSFIGSTSGTTNSVSATTDAMDTTGANLLVATVSHYGTGSSTVTDSESNLWVKAGTYNVSNYPVVLYYSIRPTVDATHTFTSTANYSAISVIAFHSENPAVFDEIDGSTSASATSLSAGSITPSEVNQVFVATVSMPSSKTISIDDNFEMFSEEPYVNGVNIGNHPAYKIKSIASNESPNFSWIGATSASAGMISFYESPTSYLTYEDSGSGGSLAGGSASVSHDVSAGGFTFIGSQAGTGAHSSTTTGLDTTGAKLLVVTIGMYGPTTLGSITDSKSNTWVYAGGHTYNILETLIYYCINPTVGSGHTVTTTGSSNYAAVVLSAYNASGDPVFDVDNYNGLASTSIPTGSVTPTGDAQVFVATMCLPSAKTVSVDSSFTQISDTPYSGGVNMANHSAYKIQTTGSAENPNFSFTGSSNASAGIATFYIESAGNEYDETGSGGALAGGISDVDVIYYPTGGAIAGGLAIIEEESGSSEIITGTGTRINRTHPHTISRINRIHPHTNGLAGAWTFRTGASYVTYDNSGYGVDGIVTNFVDIENSFAHGLHVPAFEFDGTNDYINLGSSTPNHLQFVEELTISAWIKPDSSDTNAQVFGTLNNVTESSGCGMVLFEDAGNVRVGFCVADGTNGITRESGTTNLSTKEWSLVTVTYISGTGTKIYVNGKLENTLSNVTHDLTYGTDVGPRIGFTPDAGSGVFWNGKLESVFVWNRALSSGEVGNLFNYPYGMFENKDVGYIAAFSSSQQEFTEVGSGGSLVGGEAEEFLTFTEETGGGILAGGVANPDLIDIIEVGGGLLAGGIADVQVSLNLIATGGSLVGGLAINDTSDSVEVSGGSLTGGLAELYSIYNPIASSVECVIDYFGEGAFPSDYWSEEYWSNECVYNVFVTGAITGGSADVQKSFDITTTGGLLSGGVANVQVTLNTTATGGSSVGGVAEENSVGIVQIGGGLLAGGVADVQVTLNTTTTGGSSVGGVSEENSVGIVQIDGGLLAGGIADVQVTFNPTATGGSSVGGVAEENSGGSVEVGGGILSGGVADIQVTFNPTAIGGSSVGGVADPDFIDIVQIGGGTLAGGVADVAYMANVDATGGTVVAGWSTSGKLYEETPTGGLIATGIAETLFLYSPVSIGGSIVSGDGLELGIFSPIVSGGIIVAGIAEETFNDIFEASGGVMSAGTASVFVDYNPTSVGGSIVNSFGSENVIYSLDPQGGSLCGNLANHYVYYNPIITGGSIVSGAADSDFIDIIEVGGGVNVGGIAVVSSSGLIEIDGGAVLAGGLAEVDVIYNIEFSGGAVASGVGNHTFIDFYIPDGGVISSGEADQTFTDYYIPDGGVLSGGTSEAYAVYVPPVYGGSIISGSSDVEDIQNDTFVFTGSGGISVSGNSKHVSLGRMWLFKFFPGEIHQGSKILSLYHSTRRRHGNFYKFIDESLPEYFVYTDSESRNKELNILAREYDSILSKIATMQEETTVAPIGRIVIQKGVTAGEEFSETVSQKSLIDERLRKIQETTPNPNPVGKTIQI